MSFGFLATNTNGKILISDLMKNLHLKETITNPSSISVPYTTFDGFSKFTYETTCSTTPVPFFSMPFTDRFYCCTGIKNTSGNNWQIEIQSSGGFPSSGATSSTQGSQNTSTNTREPSSGTYFNDAGNTLRLDSNSEMASSGYSSGEYYAIFRYGNGSLPFADNGNDLGSIIWNGTVVVDNIALTHNTSTNAFTSITQISAGGYTYHILDTSNNPITTITQTPDFQHMIPSSQMPNGVAYVYQKFRIYRVANQTTVTTGSSWNNPTGSYASNQSPDVYVFADPSAISASDTYGFQVKNTSGVATFDSRMRPLQISDTINITHPTTASSASASGLSARNCSSDHSSNFAPSVTSDHTTLTQPNKPMFFFRSLSQRHHEQSVTEAVECDGVDVGGKVGCVGVERTYNWRSTYWAFYRCALKRTSNTNLRAGWITNQHACYHSRSTDSSFFGVDGLAPDSSAQGDGKHPWNDANINNAQNVCIIGDGSLYD